MYQTRGRLFAFSDRVQIPLCGNIHVAVGHDGRVVDLVRETNLVQNLQLCAGLEHPQVPVFSADEDCVVSDQRGTPDRGFRFVFPERLAGVCVQTVDKTTVIRDIHKGTHDRHGCQTAVDTPGLPEERPICRIDACQGAWAASMQGILTDGHIHSIVMKDRCADDLAGPFPIELAVKTPVLSTLVWA